MCSGYVFVHYIRLKNRWQSWTAFLVLTLFQSCTNLKHSLSPLFCSYTWGRYNIPILHVVAFPLLWARFAPWTIFKKIKFIEMNRRKTLPLIGWPLRWRHNDNGGVSNHQPHYCLLNRLFRHRSKKTSKLRVTGLCVGNSPGPVNSPHKGPLTRNFFPFDDVIMQNSINSQSEPMLNKYG